MTIKERTNIFNICVGLFNIAIGLAIELSLVFFLIPLLMKMPNVEENLPMNILLPFILFAGLIIAIVISINVIQWAIKTFHLENKLDPKVVSRYIKKDSL